ncbi:MAG: DMT family transporter [Chloroflexota bacterium]
MLGVLFAVVSSFSFAMNGVLVRRGMVVAKASQGAFITVLMGVPMFALATLVTGQFAQVGEPGLRGYALLASAGIIHFGIGRYCNYRAIGAIGAARSGPIQTLTIPYSIIVAWLLLDEPVTWLMAAGIALIMAGPALMVQKRTPKAAAKPPPAGAAPDEPEASGTRQASTFQPNMMEGYTFALLAAVFYGTSPILIRAALEGTTETSILGGMVAYTGAALVLVATLALPARRDMVSAINPRVAKAFFGAGVAIFLAQMFRFIALSMAPVAVVTPIQRSSSIFTLVLSWFINRSLEAINLRVVLAVLISVCGAMVLVYTQA